MYIDETILEKSANIICDVGVYTWQSISRCKSPKGPVAVETRACLQVIALLMIANLKSQIETDASSLYLPCIVVFLQGNLALATSPQGRVYFPHY